MSAVSNRYDRVEREYESTILEVEMMYNKLHKLLDDRMRDIEMSVMAEEVDDLIPCPISEGDRVWCSSYKRFGTVTSAVPAMRNCLRSTSAYSPRKGLGAYDLEDRNIVVKWGNGQVGRYYWRIEVVTDPSPKTGSVSSFTWNRKAQPTWTRPDDIFKDTYHKDGDEMYVRVHRTNSV